MHSSAHQRSAPPQPNAADDSRPSGPFGPGCARKGRSARPRMKLTERQENGWTGTPAQTEAGPIHSQGFGRIARQRDRRPSLEDVNLRRRDRHARGPVIDHAPNRPGRAWPAEPVCGRRRPVIEIRRRRAERREVVQMACLSSVRNDPRPGVAESGAIGDK